MSRDDELARTATEGGAPIGAAETLPDGRTSARELARSKLGRFELEAVLGVGGMGVVHAAYDPELERRVAVKVLHGKSADARARLLREARAMAKLSHANVITVFDVGTEGGEDFVAMELIEGGTLGAWIDSAKPRPRDVIAALVAAGRGLAAAHAEGLTHRDFKPSNVLRSQSGRIVVTDFGLARAEGTEGGRAQPASGARDLTTTPALTQTGSLLGTPAYMAPEQWRSEVITPAADQFAFCVTLWEALSGKRPFGGATLEALRAEVLERPVELDDASLPRRLRPVLRRGLAIEPAKRYPSMTALLDAIERASSRRSLAVVAALIAIAAGIAIFVASRSTTHAPTCGQPAIDPDSATLTAAATPYVERWQTTRDAACEAKREVRATRLACLDAVFARIADAFRERSPGPDALADELVEPELCQVDQPPHLLAAIDRPLATAFATLARARDTTTSVDSELVAETQPPCARTLALIASGVGFDVAYDASLMSKGMALFAKIRTSAAACDDDAIKARAAFAAYTGEPGTLDRAEQAARQFPSDANRAAIDAIQADEANEAGKTADALAGYDSVLARDVAAGRTQAALATAFELMKIHLARSNPEDLAAVIALADRFRAGAGAVDRGAGIAALDARARWRLGQIAAANDEARAAGTAYSNTAFVDADLAPQTVHGSVVDERGAPVANAIVIAGAKLSGDDAKLVSQVYAAGSRVETTTAADGTFELVGARKSAMASLGDQVSLPALLAPSMTIKLGPTSIVEGDVELGGEPYTRVVVDIVIRGDGVKQIHTAPVDRTGHFKMSRIPRGKQQIVAMTVDNDPGQARNLEVDQPVVAGIHLGLHGRTAANTPLYLVGRSETASPPDAALALVVFGAHPELHGTMKQIMSGANPEQVVLGQHGAAQLAPAFAGHVEPDDLTGETTRPDEDLTVCAVGMSSKLIAGAKSTEDMVRAISDSEVGCVVVPRTDSLAIVPIPAVKRR